jgi:hypothetical protein
MQNENPYQPPETPSEKIVAEPTTLQLALRGAWRGFRTGALAGVVAAVLLLIGIGMQFPRNPLEMIGYYNLVAVPVVFALLLGVPGAVIGSLLLVILAAVRGRRKPD